ncbi:hypothetical protein BABINDRAFT_9513 [Babjeviella inositovora NRRL Y-12698]|uniref:Adenylate kinase isoenzyme 6 homolog n=1 Tax=Babjeviella inositovora NRRL Y-12698 TaxID=984486 RepID=A0A1E3QKU2_9ASCO|nr:uncharacterized protein BABINDRAFT_9513 [Babjeviella inositovora NRRL Y-12698]ODQ78303.1 hypothetical protein BABINDRAFT_9513 [Babjeviella inositovora NRRL Y-12698]
MSKRLLPNIIITGTPGCGKTSHAEYLASHNNQLHHLNISEVAKERNCITGRDDMRDSGIVDEDKLLDAIEPDMEEGGTIIDWHCCDIFPERLIDLVVVLRCDNSKLYERMVNRGYKDSKIQENLDCEIMDVISQEAREGYAEGIVIELHSEDAEQMEENCTRIQGWIDSWLKDHADGVSNELDEEGSESDESEEGSYEEEVSDEEEESAEED